MATCIFLNEGRSNWPIKKGKDKLKETLFIQENVKKMEEFLSKNVKAYMDLMLLDMQGASNNNEGVLQGKELKEDVSKVNVWLSHWVIVDNTQIFFLDNTWKTLDFCK